MGLIMAEGNSRSEEVKVEDEEKVILGKIRGNRCLFSY